MNKPGIEAVMSAGLIACVLGGGVLAGCAAGPADGHEGERGDAISCGYFVERGTYSLFNFQSIDFGSDALWSTGTSLSRHMRNPSGAFAWVPLSQSTLLQHGVNSAGGLGKVSNDGRCNETLSLFDDIEDLVGDPDGFTEIEQQAELSFAPVGFAFPATLADAAAAPERQDVAVRVIADLTRDKTRLVSGGEVRQQVAKQTVVMTASCSPSAQVTRKWAAKTDRDDPAFCRAAGAGFECVQFNLAFDPERCTLEADASELALPSGKSDVALGGSLRRQAPADYVLRIDDIRLFGAAR
jgi:hypothetical protein